MYEKNKFFILVTIIKIQQACNANNDMMLDDHKDDTKAFGKTAKECKDADMKKFPATTLPVLMIHLDSAKAIKGKN